MKKTFCCLTGLLLLLCCGSKQTQIDRIYEDGVEIVLNHLEPYRIPNEASRLVLDKEYVIDSESPEMFEAGLTDIYQFGVDSTGIVYLTQRPRKDGKVIFKFDATGRFQRSFGRVGQGPGEIEGSSYFGINSVDDIFVLDTRRKKVLTFAPSGDIVKETLIPHMLLGAIPLENGSFIVPGSQELQEKGFEEETLSIFDSQFNEKITFCRFKVPAYSGRAEKINAFYSIPIGSVTSKRIYVGIPGDDYEVHVYNLEGALQRKIRKKYKPIAVTSGFRKEAMARIPASMAERIYFPDHRPSFQYFFADDAGRLFVMTSEQDEATGRNICDVFNASGVFINRVAVGYHDRLRTIWEGMSLDVVAKNGRLYMLHEKENGFKELEVYKAIWH